MKNLAIKQRLWAYIDETQDELLSLCSELIQRPSLNPPIQPIEITQFIADYFDQWQVPYEITGAGPDLPIIIAKVGGQDSNGYTLCFNGHSDVVPPGDLSKWDFDPHCGVITDTRILGRGASDMLCGVAMDMHILRLIVQHHMKVKGTIVMHIVPDEESGGEKGTCWLTQNGYCEGIDGVVLGEPTSWTNIETGAKGGLWATIKTHGTQAHASIASFISENAVAKICRFLGRMEELRQMKAETKESQRQVIENSKQEARNNFGVDQVGEAIDHVTYNVSPIKSGADGKGEAEYCQAGIHFRIPNGIRGEDLAANFLNIAEECGVEAEIHRITEPAYTPAENPLVQSAVENACYIWKREVRPVYQWASSDGLYYRHLGIPAIQNGPCNPGIHSYNETADIEEIINIAKNHFAIAADLVGLAL